jgi:pyroglutamyl-peptidase
LILLGLFFLLSFATCNIPDKKSPIKNEPAAGESIAPESEDFEGQPKILIFGFTPYHGKTTNVSELALYNIDYPGAVTWLLDTAYSATDTVSIAIEQHQPDYVIELGQNEDDVIWVNERADNLIDSFWADNEGIIIRESPVIENGPAALYSDLPVEIETDIPYRILIGEGSAGDFVCNAVYYRLLHDSSNSGYRAIMIHLPRTDREQSDRFLRNYLDALQP